MKDEKILKNNVVFFGKKTLNKNDSHKELKFYLYLLKEHEEGDEEKIVRDNLGRLIKEKFKDERYTIVNKNDFELDLLSVKL